MSWHVIRSVQARCGHAVRSSNMSCSSPLIVVDVLDARSAVSWGKALKSIVQVFSYIGVAVFIQSQRGRGVLQEDVGQAHRVIPEHSASLISGAAGHSTERN